MDYMLKPCPFCDGAGEVYNVNEKYCVKCSECGASLPHIYTLRDFAIMKWNQRGWVADNREDD